MHVGHLRTTIIGDALCRVLAWLGHTVIRQNHVGDWGTPFGMLIEHLLDIGEEEAAHELSVGELTRFYQEARVKFDADPGFAERARQRVVACRPATRRRSRLWRLLVEELEALLQPRSTTGSACCSPTPTSPARASTTTALASVAAELERVGLAVVDDGALCVFPPGFTGRDGRAAAADRAQVRRRLRLRGHRPRRAAAPDHGAAAASASSTSSARRRRSTSRWSSPSADGGMAGRRSARAEHVAFGSVLGPDGRMLRTRAGETPKLIDLLDEAVERAGAAVADEEPGPAGRRAAATWRGRSASARSSTPTSRPTGSGTTSSTGTACCRSTATPRPTCCTPTCVCRASSARAGGRRTGRATRTSLITEPEERALALALLAVRGAWCDPVADTLEPHRLCTYLFELAQAYTAFFEACPVLRAPSTDAAQLPAGAVRAHGPHARVRTGTAGHRDRRADVTSGHAAELL